MNNSPLFLIAINRLIGRTMRQRQLAKADYTQLCLSHAVDWLNRSRLAYKQNDKAMAYARLSWALSAVRSAIRLHQAFGTVA